MHCKDEVDSNFVNRIFLEDDGREGFSDKITPKGLSDDREKYLFTKY